MMAAPANPGPNCDGRAALRIVFMRPPNLLQHVELLPTVALIDPRIRAYLRFISVDDAPH